MFNKIILVGNLTRDPELRYMPNGSAVCTTGIATNRKFKKQDGTQGEEVCFVDLTFFGRTAEIVNQYLKRGSKILAEGRLKFDQWTDQNGGKRSKHSVVVESMKMLEGRQNGDNNNNHNPNTGSGYPSGRNNSSYQPQQQGQPQQRNAQAQSSAPQNNIPEINVDEDEIPF